MTHEKSTIGLSEETLRKIVEYKQRDHKRKQEYLGYHKNRHPIYPSTNEEGTFVGLIGYGTAAGVRIFPYYRTEGGVYFYESDDPREEENPSRKEKRVTSLDIEEIQKEGIAKLYTPDSFLGNPQGAPDNLPHSQGDTPGDAR